VTAVGFDSSRLAIEAANQMKPRAARLGSQADLTFLCIAQGNPWPVGQFEAVTMIDVMHHLPTALQRSFLTLACQKVQPGGKLVYKDISDRRFWYAAMNRVHDLVIAREWSRYVPLATVEQWAASEGLQVVSRESRKMLWYDHDLVIFRPSR
jgi:2-polyprenyl-3-methyl-5-hydroxy-6-metoxy-1,4-benzoquinol methylase